MSIVAVQRRGRSGREAQDDLGMEYTTVHRNTRAGAFVALMLLLVVLVMYVERTELFEALAGAKAYVYGSLVTPAVGDDQTPADAAPQLQAGSVAGGSRTEVGGADSAQAVSIPKVLEPAAPRVITVIQLKDNTTMQILDEPLPASCYAEARADYDGAAVKWGLGNKARSAAECCRQCREFQLSGRDGQPCNVWVWCGDPSGVCWSMDIHTHTTGDCWLKYQAGWDGETDRQHTNLVVNHRDRFSDAFRQEHKTAPELVPWVAGLIPPTTQQQQAAL